MGGCGSAHMRMYLPSSDRVSGPPTWGQSRTQKAREVQRGYRTRTDHIPGAICGAPLAGLDRASEFLATPLFNQHKLPALVKHLLDLFGHVDDARRRDQVVVLLDVAVVEFFEPEAVGVLAIGVRRADVNPMPNLTLATQGRQGCDVRVHCSKHDSSVRHLAANVPRPIVPIDAQCVDGLGGVVVGMQEFHDAAQVVWLARRLAHEVHMICSRSLR